MEASEAVYGKDLFFIEDQVKMPFMSMPNRCTIVRLKNNQLVIISPTKNFAEHKDRIDSFGSVVAIVEPNMFHHLFTAAAKKLYPKAQLFGVAGHFTKCPQIPWESVLSAETWPWQQELPVIKIEGMPKVQEHVFYFKNEKTLIVTDLCFNIVSAKGPGAWMILNLFGTYNRFGVSRLLLKFVSDKKALSDSIKKVFDCDFSRLVMAHGAVLEANQNPKEKLINALRKI